MSYLKNPLSEMTEQLKLRWVMIFSTLFIVLNTLFIALELYWFMLVPLVLLVIVAAFLAMDTLILVIVFCTPLSVLLKPADFDVAISIPTEPLLFGVMVLYLIRLFYDGRCEMKLFFHPVTVSILAYLTWIFVTCITSSLPIVSWKFLLSRLWFVIPFYFVTLHLFKEKKNITKHLWLYMSSFALIIIYTLINHGLNDFSESAGHIAMNPFYNDHTSYGAMLSMYLPPLLFLTFSRYSSINIRAFGVLLLVIFVTGWIFSYTRAAWLSVAVAIVSLLIYLLRIRLIPILSLVAVLIALFFIYKNEIMVNLEAGHYKNSKNRNIEQRIQSITNVTTDASNTERFNRWASAIRMFKEKPFFGWGPGTFQFQYAPFQISSEKTQISTNFGEKGNSHSEYIGPLAETGVIGLLTFLGIIGASLFTAGKLIYNSPNRRTRAFAIAIILGLITYYVHGGLNNFLDTDKASAPFWGFIAMLVTLDLSEREKIKHSSNPSLTEKN